MIQIQTPWETEILVERHPGHPNQKVHGQRGSSGGGLPSNLAKATKKQITTAVKSLSKKPLSQLKKDRKEAEGKVDSARKQWWGKQNHKNKIGWKNAETKRDMVLDAIDSKTKGTPSSEWRTIKAKDKKSTIGSTSKQPTSGAGRLVAPASPLI
jgi:hypothetical protein